MELGKQIKKYRAEINLSQEELADKIFVSRQTISNWENAKFQKDSTIFTVLFIALLIVPVPLVMLWKWFGMTLYLCLFGIGMYFAVRIEKAREEGKAPYQKALLAAGSAVLVVIIALIMTAVIRFFS